MKKDNYKTQVIFRKYEDSQIIALFPYEIADNKGRCNSYMHIGQHSGADYLGVINTTKLATKKEYKDLKKELQNIGYNIQVMKKRSYAKYIDKFNEQRKRKY